VSPWPLQQVFTRATGSKYFKCHSVNWIKFNTQLCEFGHTEFNWKATNCRKKCEVNCVNVKHPLDNMF